MGNASSYADTAIGLHAMASCGARLAEVELPALGETVDLAEAIGQLDTSEHDFSIDSASITYESDTASGSPIYATHLTGELTDVPRDLTKTFSVTIRHVPTKSDNSAYQGAVQFVIDDFEESNDAVISVLYGWSDKQLNYRYRQVQVPEADAESFDEESREVKPDLEGSSAWTEVIVDSDHQGYGRLAFVWNTFDLLVFNAVTESDGTGVAFFGHTSSETEEGTADYYKIAGLRCFPVNPSSLSDPYSDYVQRQTLTLNSTDGTWELDASDITYAPTNSCAWSTDNDPSSQATFTVKRDGSDSGNQVTENLAFPIALDLFSQATYATEWIAPNVPETF